MENVQIQFTQTHKTNEMYKYVDGSTPSEGGKVRLEEVATLETNSSLDNSLICLLQRKVMCHYKRAIVLQYR